MGSPAPRRIGLDLDNTIIDYAALIREEIAALGLIAASAADKRTLRDALRGIENGEAHWMRLQARIYGPRLGSAQPFAGVNEFIHRATDAGCELVIVSHKTQVAAADETGFDLHAASRTWLAEQKLVGEGAIRANHVFFESTRAAKVARIASLGLQAFIDDLPEVFAEGSFPPDVKRWLFSPVGSESIAGVDHVFTSWSAIERHVFG